MAFGSDSSLVHINMGFLLFNTTRRWNEEQDMTSTNLDGLRGIDGVRQLPATERRALKYYHPLSLSVLYRFSVVSRKMKYRY